MFDKASTVWTAKQVVLDRLAQVPALLAPPTLPVPTRTRPCRAGQRAAGALPPLLPPKTTPTRGLPSRPPFERVRAAPLPWPAPAPSRRPAADGHAHDTRALQDLQDPNNYGLYQPPDNGRAGKFLLEERLIDDYALRGPVAQLQVRARPHPCDTARPAPGTPSLGASAPAPLAGVAAFPPPPSHRRQLCPPLASLVRASSSLRRP